MADDTVLNPGSGGDTIATDDLTTLNGGAVSGIKAQRVKVGFGSDGAFRDVDASNGLPVADGGGSITVDGSVSIGSALPAGTNNIGDVDVLTLPSLPAGTNAIGTLAANSGVDIGDVTINNASGGSAVNIQDGGNAITVDNGGTFVVQENGAALTALQLIDNIVQTEDTASANGDSGVVAFAVRKATPANTSGTDGDYEALQVSAGRLWASAVIDTALPAGTNNIGDVDVASIAAGDNNIGNVDVVTLPNVTIGTMANLTESLVDDAAFTPATSRVLPAGFTFDDVAPDSVNEGDIGAARMSANRNIYTTLRDAAGNERGANVNGSNQLSVSVDNNPVLGAGTNGIGKLTANSGVDIGDVDVTSVIPGTGATNLGKAEDAAHTTGDTGVLGLAVRRDANTSLVDTDGDYAPLQVNSAGSLKVAIISGGGSGGTSATDDAAFTVATDSGTPMMGVVTADSVDSGDVGVVGMLANRQLKVTLYDSSGVELSVGGGTQYTEDAAAAANPVGNALNLVRDDARGGSLTSADGDNVAARGTNAGELYVKHVDAIPVTDNSGSLTVDGTVAVSSISTSVTPGTGATNLGKAEDAAHSSADVGVMILSKRTDTAASSAGTDGDYATINTDANGLLYVNGSGVTQPVGGNIAHDGADSGNPVKVGYKAIAHGANPTAVAANDRTDAYANRAGIPWVIGGHPNVVTIEAAYTSAQTDTAIVTVSTGTKIVVTQVQVVVSAANTVNAGLRVGFGTANTPTTTGVVLTHPALAPGSGVSRGDGSGIIGVGADNEDLRITSDVPTGGSLRVIVSYYTVES